MRKLFLGGFVLLGLIIAGFIFLLRGCLSKYDERSAMAPALYFEKQGQPYIFSIVEFEKTTSYQRNGGFTNKTVTTNYFLQLNDGVTGQKISDKKIKNHRDVRIHPIEMIGAIDQTAWVFIGELMAFDPFTLTKTADIKILEEKNPSLKGGFPVERKYYEFDETIKAIFITMKDGSRWKLDPQTLLASLAEEKTEGEDKNVAAIRKQLKQNSDAHDTLMEQKLRRPSRMLSAREITMAQYQKLMQGFNEDRSRLYKIRDSLQLLVSKAEKEKRSNDDTKRTIANLKGKINVYFTQIKTNADTSNGQWYGLYTSKEMEKLYDRFQYQPAYEDPARRQLYRSVYSRDKYDEYIINKERATPVSGNLYYLNGGFLLDKKTGQPLRLSNPDAYLIVYKNQVGNDGKIQISRVGRDGKSSWVFDTQLKEWADWIVTDKRIYIFGNDNKNLSSSDTNVLLCIDLSSGHATKYDYFTDK